MLRFMRTCALAAVVVVCMTTAAPAAPRKELIALEEAFVEIAEQVRPSVVNVRSERSVLGLDHENLPEFFRFFPHRNMPPGGLRQQAAGSGFILDEQGHILTNNHLVSKAKKVEVRIEHPNGQRGRDREWIEAEVVGTDPASDLAVLRLIDVPDDMRPAALGTSKDLRVGQWAIAIGDPYGLDKTVTVGVISALGRHNFRGALRDVQFQDFIQTDASINPGNSGGPLVNLRGEVIGISTFILSESGGAVGIGFAIPIDLARGVFEDLIRYKKVFRGYLGVVISDITHEKAQAFNIEQGGGALVEQVMPDTPAERGGLIHGDVILRINGEPVFDAAGLQHAVAQQNPDDTVELEVLRRGKIVKKQITLEERPSQLGVATRPEVESKLGLATENITPEIAEERNIERRGVLITEVDPSGPAARKGIEPGHIILEVANTPVNSTKDLMAEVAKLEPGTWFTLWVQDENGRTRFIPLRVPAEGGEE